MKVHVGIVILLLEITILNSFSLNNRKHLSFSSEEVMDDGEMGDFKKILNRFNLMSKKSSNVLDKIRNNKINSHSMMRFKSETKDDNDDSQEVVADIKFPDEGNSFLSSNGIKDKELKRIEGLSNGLIIYNNRRTVNAETSDYSHLYFDLLEN